MRRTEPVEKKRDRAKHAVRTLVLLIASVACTDLGPPPMEPLTERSLEAAERRWDARGADSYHLVVRLRAPRTTPAVYDVTVADERVVEVTRDGGALPSNEADDWSMTGLFHLLRGDLRIGKGGARGAAPPVDLRAEFEPESGRLVRYRRTVGTARRRVLLIEVLTYEPHERTGRAG